MPNIDLLPAPPSQKTGWPWTEQTDPSLFDRQKSYPKICIVMPTYNQGLYIEEAIRSLLLQNYPNLEFIIMDGGSTDDTVSIIKKYEPWINFWTSGKDGGQSHAINMGLARSTGEWFNWLNSDDYLLPDAFFHLSEAIMKEKEKPVAVCGEPLVQPLTGPVRKLPGNTKDKFYEDFIALGYYQVTALYDIDKVRFFGGVDESLHFGMDLKLVMQMNFVGETIRTGEYVVVMRSHAESKGFAQAAKFYKDWLIAYSSAFSYIPSEVRNNKLFEKLEEVTGVNFKQVPQAYQPVRFTESQLRHAQLYMGERIINLMYIYNQKGVGEITRFYRKNYPEYYKNTNLWFVRFKDYPVIRICIKVKKKLLK